MIRSKINLKRVVYFLIFLFCSGVSLYQLLGCIGKLRHPPITTHYRFGLNETLNYPAVTVCRNPPYKLDILRKYNLGEMNSGMEETSQWENFPFNSVSLQKVWDEATYKLNEVIPMFGLHGIPENVEVVSSYHYLKGQCFTLIPKTGEQLTGPSSGWSLILKHDHKRLGRIINDESNITLDKVNYKKSSFDSGSGFHIFIHHVREPYYENKRQTSSITEHVYLEVGEELEIKLIAEQFNQISTSSNPCETDINYSASKCAEMKRWKDISNDVGCIGPWMNGIYLPQCWNVNQFKKLLQRYLTFEENVHSCNRSCNLTAYKLFVVNRVPSEISSYSALFVYYTSKHVTVMEEKLGYDWNFFLSDIGGSLGFFLGISVVGIVGIVENLIAFCGSNRKEEKDDDKPPEYSESCEAEKKSVV